MVDSDDADTLATAIESDATLASPVTPRTGATLPSRYRLAGSLGQGGMGEVLLAKDTQIDRDVAIKRMLIEPTGPSVARFLREARVQGRLDHPAIVPVYELATDTEGRPFFVMKRLAGTTLADVLRDPQGFTRQKLLRAFADVCLAVELAHSRGVIHRDLKPSNIMLGDFGEVYVLDWGIARVLGETDPEVTTVATDGNLTQVGAIMGTPGYIAPELVRGEPINNRADVFALGCILFEILTGQALLQRASIASVLDDFDPRPSARMPDHDIAPELDAICARALGQEPANRPTARALAEQVEKFLDGDRDLAQRKQLAALHLAAARAAIARGDTETERALAMSEAGRALALDPTSGAADVLGRLMLEPPKHVPQEVVDKLRDLDDMSTRTKARTFLPSYMLTLLMFPGLVWIGLHGWFGWAGFLGADVLNIGVCIWVMHRRGRTTRFDLSLAIVANLILVLVCTRLFGPLTIAPGIAVVIAILFASDTRLRLWLLLGLTVASLIVPFLLEMSGLWPSTLIAQGDDLVIHSTYFTYHLPEVYLAFVFYFVVIIVVSGAASRTLATNERTAIKTIELQAWHLRQLVKS